jgi:hypothetical protein
MFLAELEKNEEAFQVFKRAEEIDPNHPTVSSLQK